MLKKQTVWLLTMLSLMIVLSVYYLNAPSEGDLAYSDSDQDLDSEQEQTTSSQITDDSEESQSSGEETDAVKGEEGATQVSENFAAVRMEVMNQRGKEKELLESVVASDESTTEEKDEAYEAMKEIETLDSKERLLEDTIKALDDYEQVLVRHVSEGNAVVTVQTESLTTTEANNIIQHAKDELGEIKIDVVYKSS